MNNNRNNRFDEIFHHVPLREIPRSHFENHHLNAIVWRRPLERQQLQRRDAVHKMQLAEIEENYRQVFGTHIWAMQQLQKQV